MPASHHFSAQRPASRQSLARETQQDVHADQDRIPFQGWYPEEFAGAASFKKGEEKNTPLNSSSSGSRVAPGDDGRAVVDSPAVSFFFSAARTWSEDAR